MRSRRGILAMGLAGIVTAGVVFASMAAAQTEIALPSAKAPRLGGHRRGRTDSCCR